MKMWLPLLCGMLVSCWAAVAGDLLKIGDPVPEFPASAEWYAGGTQKINDFGDKKALVLYFAKPGCPSCDSFAPHLYRLLLKNSATLRVIMVSPGQYPGSDVADWVARRTLGDYPVMRDAEKSFAPLFIGKVDKFPYVAVITNDGKLAWFGRAKFHGQITTEVKRALARPAENKNEKGMLDGVSRVLLVAAANSSAVTAPLLSPVKDCARLAEILKNKKIAHEVLGADAAPLTAEKITAAWEKMFSANAGHDKKTEEKPTAAPEKPMGKPAVSPARRAFVLYYSGDALARPLDAERMDIVFRPAEGTVSLADLVKKLPADTDLTVIVDAMHADRFAGLDDKTADDYLFPDIIDAVGKAFPGVKVMLSAARWDKSLLADAAGGTLFARYLAEELAKEKVPAAETLWRTLRDRLADYGRQTGELQSPAFAHGEK